MRIHGILIGTVAATATAGAFARGPTKYPGLNYVHPVAVQRGVATDVVIDTNGDVKAAHKVLAEGAGIATTVLPRDAKSPAGQVKARFVVAADAEIGPRELRVADKAAITTAGIVYVTAYPVVVSPENNDKPAAALAIGFPQVVCGRLEQDVDEDWFRFQAKRGEQINFSVLGARVHESIHKIGRFITHLDASLLVTDADGHELGSNDDFYFADPQFSFIAPRDGDYRLRVSEATYKGNPFYTYALLCTKGPFVRQARPFAIPPGTMARRQLFGPGVGPAAFGELTMPATIAEGAVFWVRPRIGNDFAAEVPALACNLPIDLEKEPNDDAATAQSMRWDAAVSGTIGRPGDVDRFAFHAEKGVAYDFEVFARRLFSPLDSELTVLDAKGRRLVDADDTKLFAAPMTKDSKLAWTAPATGEFELTLRDKLGRGGPEFGYHLRCRKALPDFKLSCDPIYSMIGPGSRSPIFVRIDREADFAETVHLEVRGLPKGVRASADELRPHAKDALVILAADNDAPIGAANIDIIGRATVTRAGKRVELVRRATPLHEIYQAQRRAGRTVAVAVTEPSDIQIETSVKEIALRPGARFEIPVTVKRAPKYKGGSVTLWENWRFERNIFGNVLPAGVTIDAAASKLALNGDDAQGKVTLVAAADAKPSPAVLTAIIGQVAIEFSVFVPYCTAPISIRVAP